MPNLVMTNVSCPIFPRINFYNSPFGDTQVLADAFAVITNSRLKDTTVCAPAFTGEVGATKTRQVDALPAGSTLPLGLG